MSLIREKEPSFLPQINQKSNSIVSLNFMSEDMIKLSKGIAAKATDKTIEKAPTHVTIKYQPKISTIKRNKVLHNSEHEWSQILLILHVYLNS